MLLKHKKLQKVVYGFPYPTQSSSRFWLCLDALRQHDFRSFQRIADGGGRLPNHSGGNITNARNEIVRMFLDNHDADWLWFIDTDMTFDPDLLDRLVQAAHPVERPIMGALCFSVQDGYRACPTLYVIRDDGRVGRMYDYPRDTVVRTFTGTGCLLIHRTALEKMRQRFPSPWEWFQESKVGDMPVGEDLTFCIRAESIGIPVHVDTAIKCGHEKSYVVDESVYDAQRLAGIGDTSDLNYPTFVVIAAKNRHDMTLNLIDQLGDDKQLEVLLYDNGSDPPFPERTQDATGWPLHRMWNDGLEAAEAAAWRLGVDKWNVAVLNNDLEVPAGFFAKLEAGLRADDNHWISYPNHHGLDIPDNAFAVTKNDQMAGQTMSGWAFLLRGESGLRFDEQFQFWYGDSDLQQQVEAAGKNVVCVGGCYCEHLHPMESSTDPDRVVQIREDEKRFATKWGLDPNTLWLALNPGFGQ